MKRLQKTLPGSAKPVVSIMTPLNVDTFLYKFFKALTKSPRTFVVISIIIKKSKTKQCQQVHNKQTHATFPPPKKKNKDRTHTIHIISYHIISHHDIRQLTVQQIQPFITSMTSSSTFSLKIFSSIPTSPNSFSMTANFIP